MRDATTADLPKTAMRQRNPEPGVQRHAAYQVHPPHTVPHRSCRRGQPANVPCDGECGGVLLSHILSGAVPSPCQALASGFGMGSGRLTWAMAAANLQFFFPPLGWGMVPGGGPGTGGWTRCFVVPCLVTVLPVVRESGRRGRRAVDCPSSVSTGQLHPSRGFHVRPINHHGTLILEQASRLDAFSGYPFRT